MTVYREEESLIKSQFIAEYASIVFFLFFFPTHLQLLFYFEYGIALVCVYGLEHL